MNATNVENNNPGPASMILFNGAKDLDIACSVIMGEGDVLKNPLNITDAEYHECRLDEKTKKAQRKYDGKLVVANFDKMRRIKDARISQGRPVTQSKSKQTAESER